MVIGDARTHNDETTSHAIETAGTELAKAQVTIRTKLFKIAAGVTNS